MEKNHPSIFEIIWHVVNLSANINNNNDYTTRLFSPDANWGVRNTLLSLKTRRDELLMTDGSMAEWILFWIVYHK